MSLARWALLVLCIGPASRAWADAYDPPAAYYSSATGTGDTLRRQLYAITSAGFTYVNYGDSRYALGTLWADPSASGKLLAAYSGSSVSSAWDNGITWNREHLTPQSALGISVSNTYKGYGSDLFELAPSIPSENGARGNLGYGYTGSTATPSQGTFGTVRGTDGNTYWFAGDQWKGDAARSMFYMATRYGYNQGTSGTIDSSNKYNITLANGVPNTTGRIGDLNSLLHWAYEDPVDTFERRKNALVYAGVVGTNGLSYKQGNRNPYIDHPEYIWAAFGTKANTSQIAVGTAASNGSSAATIDLGRVIVGTAFGTGSLTITKAGDTPTTFNVTASGSASSSLAGTGETFTYNAQSRGMQVGLSTSTKAGAVAGTVLVHNTDLTSSGTGTGSADGDDVVSVSGTAVDHANGSFLAGGSSRVLNLDFGTIVQGTGVQTLAFSLFNLPTTAGYTAALDLDGVTGTGSTGKLSTNLTPFAGLAAGASRAFVAQVDTSTPGALVAKFVLAVSDENIPGATAGAPLELNLSALVTAAAPEPTSLLLAALGSIPLLGRRRSR